VQGTVRVSSRASHVIWIGFSLVLELLRWDAQGRLAVGNRSGTDLPRPCQTHGWSTARALSESVKLVPLCHSDIFSSAVVLLSPILLIEAAAAVLLTPCHEVDCISRALNSFLRYLPCYTVAGGNRPVTAVLADTDLPACLLHCCCLLPAWHTI
jgi:hypothetical protein